jgi:signal transduction histidine kinase
VLNECLNNTIKHAEAKNVFIVISMEKNKLSVIYSDNGIGFDTQKDRDRKEGIGLYNIKNRISSIGGSTEILSAQGLGTRIKIEIKNAD